MEIFQEKYTFTNFARTHLDRSVVGVFDELVKKWGLFNWEDGLL